MGRAPCCDKANVKKGPWSPEEDAKLKAYIEQNGTGGNWIALPQKIGLKRCGKSCRLRWLNYLRPDIKHGGFSEEEDNLICSLYISIGSRWSVIAAQLPGRTDNDIKNYWNTRLKKKLLAKQQHQQQQQHRREQQAARGGGRHDSQIQEIMMLRTESSAGISTTNVGAGHESTKPQLMVSCWPELPPAGMFGTLSEAAYSNCEVSNILGHPGSTSSAEYSMNNSCSSSTTATFSQFPNTAYCDDLSFEVEEEEQLLYYVNDIDRKSQQMVDGMVNFSSGASSNNVSAESSTSWAGGGMSFSQANNPAPQSHHLVEDISLRLNSDFTESRCFWMQ